MSFHSIWIHRIFPVTRKLSRSDMGVGADPLLVPNVQDLPIGTPLFDPTLFHCKVYFLVLGSSRRGWEVPWVKLWGPSTVYSFVHT